MTTDAPHDLRIEPELPQDLSVPIGCIGSGFIMSQCHLPAYRQAGMNPVGIASRNVENARRVAAQHRLSRVFDSYHQMLEDHSIEVFDIAVPPDCQLDVISEIVRHPHARGILAQKPLADNYDDAWRIVDMCRQADVTLCGNQNMRYDQSVRATKTLLDRGELGDPVLATIDMRAIPHWMPWQERQGWLTCRIMSIHHLDVMRYWFGDPDRVYASFRPDPRTKFPHVDGIGLYILEYDSGMRCMICDDVWTGPAREGAAADLGIRYRIEGTEGLLKGEIGWPSYPERQPSTIDYTTIAGGDWQRPRWPQVWFPDAFQGPMAELLVALENDTQPSMSGDDHLTTMILVENCYLSANERFAIETYDLGPPE